MTTLSPVAGVPEGDQLFDRVQLPLDGLDVLPEPFQVLVVISPGSLAQRHEQYRHEQYRS
jgi:hypothetical protein